nr:unnamed protein product [Haemonchus contortus]
MTVRGSECGVVLELFVMSSSVKSKRKPNRTSQPVLYPVKKATFRQEERADSYCRGTDQLPERSMSMCCADYLQWFDHSNYHVMQNCDRSVATNSTTAKPEEFSVWPFPAAIENEAPWLPNYQESTLRKEDPQDQLLCQSSNSASFLVLPPNPVSLISPTEGCMEQGNDIDYSLFDEFFVRT